jgi:hypothetical protein
VRKYLFLFLALAFFAGIIAIFIVDGYLGIYDTVYLTSGEFEQKIEPDFWQRQGGLWSISANWGDKVFFRYEADNRRFSTYSTTIQASVWKENEKITNLLVEDKVIKPFEVSTQEWTLDSMELESLGFIPGQYTVRIERDGVELRIIVFYITNPGPGITPRGT